MPEVRLVHNFNVKPGMEEEYKGLWHPEYDVINGQPGCDQWELFQSTRFPENFALLESWESRGAFYSYWNIQKVRPVAGKECIDDPANRKYGRAGSEIYWNRKLYRPDGTVWKPADGQVSEEEAEGGNNPVRLVINMAAKEGMTDQYAEAWSPHFDEVNEEPGCLQYELFRSTRNEENLCLLELWASRDAFQAHWELEVTRPSLTREFAAGPGERRVGSGGVEIYYKVRPYTWDGQNWTPLE